MRGIFFDAVGTLFDLPDGVGVPYFNLAKKYGASPLPSASLLEKRFQEAFQESPPLAFPGVATTDLEEKEKEWWRNLVKTVFDGVTIPSFESFFEELYCFFGGRTEGEGPFLLFPETIEALEYLSQRRHHLGIISNFDSRIEPVLKSLGIFHFFQTITFSTGEGVTKPSAEIFKRALRKAGCFASDAIYVGDHLHHDVEGAKAAGIFSLLIDRSRDPLRDPSGIPNEEPKKITTLLEIKNYLTSKKG